MLQFFPSCGQQKYVEELFERESLDEIISGIERLPSASEREWGKMDAAQMLANCSAEKWAAGLEQRA